MIFALALLFFGATATFGRPNSIMVSYEGTTTLPPMENFEETTTTPPMVNFMDNSPNPNIIHLRYDKDTQAEMLARDPSYWVQWRPSWNTGSNDDNSTLHIDPHVNDNGRVRIMDGWNAHNGQRLFMAKLSLSFDTGGFNCDSTILSDYWLLTAAHCILSDSRSLQSAIARFGTTDSESGGYFISASMAIAHPNYTPKYGTIPSGYDIALLKLSKKLIFDSANSLVDYVYGAGLPNPSAGTQLIAAGWGITENGSTTKLNFANVTVSTCPNKYLDFSNFPSGHDSFFCTSQDSGQICSSDSGGFVGYLRADGRYAVAGVISFGPPRGLGDCGHTSVGFYKNWLFDIIKYY